MIDLIRKKYEYMIHFCRIYFIADLAAHVYFFVSKELATIHALSFILDIVTHSNRKHH